MRTDLIVSILILLNAALFSDWTQIKLAPSNLCGLTENTLCTAVFIGRIEQNSDNSFAVHEVCGIRFSPHLRNAQPTECLLFVRRMSDCFP